MRRRIRAPEVIEQPAIHPRLAHRRAQPIEIHATTPPVRTSRHTTSPPTPPPSYQRSRGTPSMRDVNRRSATQDKVRPLGVGGPRLPHDVKSEHPLPSYPAYGT